MLVTSTAPRTILFLVGAAGVVLLAACGSDAPATGGSTSPSAAAPSATSSSPSASSSGSSPSSSSSSAPASSLQAGLLTASEVGSGFAVKPQSQDDDPLPCTPSAKPIFQQYRPGQKVERVFANSGGSVTVDEAIAEYDAATAKQVFDAAVKGFSCSSATIGGQPVTITKRTDAQSSDDMQTAAWDFAVGGQLGTAAVTRIGNKFAAISFAATKAAANDVDVPAILQKAGAKVAALP